MKQPMEWKKSAPELVKRLADAMAGFDAEKKIMFGSPVYTLGGNMFTGVHAEGIFMRLLEAERREIEASFGARPFEPVRGHIMKEYVVVPPALYGERESVWRVAQARL